MDQLAKNYKTLVRKAWQLFYLSHKGWAGPIEEAGLTTTSFPVLEMIVQTPGVTQQEIADQISLDKSCTSRACKSLEEKGFIRREKCLKAAHAFRCYPTEAAIGVVQVIVEKESSYIHELFEGENAQEIERSIALLNHLVSRMKKE